MPQINIFFDERDEKKFVLHLISQEFAFIPDILYETPNPEIFSTEESYWNYKKIKPSFFLIHPKIETSPLELSRIDEGKAAGKFFIMQKSGGPVFHFICPGTYLKGDTRVVAPGRVFYYERYWNTTLKKTEKAPQVQRELFGAILKFIKANSVPSEPKGFYIGFSSAERFRQGKTELIGAVGHTYRIAESTAVK